VTVEPHRRTEYRELRVLELLAGSQEPVTQRVLARRMGVALGLANLYLKRLVRKGYLKCVNVQANRIRYLVTPQGMAEKARLTYAFMGLSLELYGQARGHLRETLRSASNGSPARLAIFGTGEAAELTYLTLREQGIEPVAVFDREPRAPFLGYPVLSVRDHATVDFDILVVASLDWPGPLVSDLTALGIPRHRLLLLRHDAVPAPARRPPEAVS
jgi:DNA-binding MarR family transcriptional regulator